MILPLKRVTSVVRGRARRSFTGKEGQGHPRRGRIPGRQQAHPTADIISQNPQALQLRFLGTLTEIAAEKNSTIIFPLPLDLLKAFTYEKPQEKK